MLAELLERVELLRTGQRLGFCDRGAEPLPRDHGGDRAIGVLLVVAGRDERGADTGIVADLLVDRPRIGLEGAGRAVPVRWISQVRISAGPSCSGDLPK